LASKFIFPFTLWDIFMGIKFSSGASHKEFSRSEFSLWWLILIVWNVPKGTLVSVINS
jgi:hypothetical protein